MRFDVLRIGHTVPSPTGNWPISITDNLCHSLGNNIDAFVHEQTYMLGNIAQPSRAGEYSRYGVIFGTASDLPSMAIAQNAANSVVVNMLSTLIQFVFAPRGSDSPGNVHRIGRLIDANADLPWAIGMLPAGATLMLNGIEQDGLTTSYYFNRLISMTDDMAHKAIKHTEDKESEATLSQFTVYGLPRRMAGVLCFFYPIFCFFKVKIAHVFMYLRRRSKQLATYIVHQPKIQCRR